MLNKMVLAQPWRFFLFKQVKNVAELSKGFFSII